MEYPSSFTSVGLVCSTRITCLLWRIARLIRHVDTNVDAARLEARATRASGLERILGMVEQREIAAGEPNGLVVPSSNREFYGIDHTSLGCLPLAIVAWGQAANPSFEVATVKPSPAAADGRVTGQMIRDPGRVSYRYVTLQNLLAQAYRIKNLQIFGAGLAGFGSF